MRERLRLLGGTLNIQSKGTVTPIVFVAAAELLEYGIREAIIHENM